MNPGETWTFTCSRVIDRQTLNIATIVAQPVDGGTPVGDPLTRSDVAFVRVVLPDIAVTKNSINPVVLSPDAEPISGPDTPTVRPATFVYDVSNTGNTPLEMRGIASDASFGKVRDWDLVKDFGFQAGSPGQRLRGRHAF